MSWSVVYRLADGEALQITTQLPDPLPAGSGTKAVGSQRPTGTWDAQALDFVPSVVTEISAAEFMDRINAVNPAAWAEIMTQASADANVAAILERFRASPRIRLDSPLTASSLGYLITVTGLTQDQVDTVLTPAVK